MLDAALAYAARGWCIFPLRGKLPCIAKVDGGNGCHDGTTDEATIRAWWKKFPKANIGLSTGPMSGLLVVDVDGEEGEENLKALNLGLPPTLTNLTGGGGRHLVFSYPPGETISISAGRLGLKIDTRGAGGYIVAPPSLHPDTGAFYEWQDDAVTIAAPPEALLALLRKPELPPRPKYVRAEVGPGRMNAYRAGMLNGIAADLGRTPLGKRNTILYAKARQCGEFADACNLSEAEAEGAIFSAIGAAGWDNEKLSRKTFDNGWKRGLTEQRQLKDRADYVAPSRRPPPIPRAQPTNGSSALAPVPGVVVELRPAPVPMDFAAAVAAIVAELDPIARLKMYPPIFAALALEDAPTQGHWKGELVGKCGLAPGEFTGGMTAARKDIKAAKLRAADEEFKAKRRTENTAARESYGLDLEDTHYSLSTDGVVKYLKPDTPPLVLCPRAFWPSAEGTDIASDDGDCLVRLDWYTAGGRHAKQWCSSAITQDRDGLRELNGAPLDLLRTAQVTAWLSDAQSHLMADRKGKVITSRLGWLTVNGASHFILPGDPRVEFTRTTKPSKGTALKWAIGLEMLVSMGDRGYIGLICAGLSAAAPLVQFVAKRNPVIGLSSATGTGKGSVMEFALAIWGAWEDFTLQAIESTSKGVQNKGRALSDLPYLVDEIHQMHKEEPRKAENAIYYLANGMDRTVAGKTGGTIGGTRRMGASFYASEYALGEMLQGGARCRVIEIEQRPLDTLEQSAILKACARDNPGAMAKKLAGIIEADRENFTAEIETEAAGIRRDFPSLQGDDGYTIAIVSAGLCLLAQATAIDIPVAAVCDWLAGYADTSRASAVDEHQRAFDSLLGIAMSAQWTPAGGKTTKTAVVNGLDLAWREYPGEGWLDINPIHPLVQALFKVNGIDRHKKAWADRGLIVRAEKGQHIGFKRRGITDRVLRIPRENVPSKESTGYETGYGENQ
jgi:hypothetical protein